MTASPVPRPELAAKPTPPLYPGQVIEATFSPHPRWSPSIQAHAGTRGTWKALWRISEGPCAGEMACVLAGGGGPSWAPESELVSR
jgi:hypothetical protein